jgi:hypothetical protein
LQANPRPGNDPHDRVEAFRPHSMYLNALLAQAVDPPLGPRQTQWQCNMDAMTAPAAISPTDTLTEARDSAPDDKSFRVDLDCRPAPDALASDFESWFFSEEDHSSRYGHRPDS